jgi:hypothetical protein
VVGSDGAGQTRLLEAAHIGIATMVRSLLRFNALLVVVNSLAIASAALGPIPRSRPGLSRGSLRTRKSSSRRNKEAGALRVDLSIDPAKTGELTVTLPDAEAKDQVRRPLLLIPAEIELAETAWSDAFQAAEVQPGEKTVSVAGVPAGKYRTIRGKSSAEVEVAAGKTAAVTLVQDEPAKK